MRPAGDAARGASCGGAGDENRTRAISLGSRLRRVLGPGHERKTAGQTLASLPADEPRCTPLNPLVTRYGMPFGADSPSCADRGRRQARGCCGRGPVERSTGPSADCDLQRSVARLLQRSVARSVGCVGSAVLVGRWRVQLVKSARPSRQIRASVPALSAADPGARSGSRLRATDSGNVHGFLGGVRAPQERSGVDQPMAAIGCPRRARASDGASWRPGVRRRSNQTSPHGR
jgi:hypothetical protein